ncbi:GntR family transcriptional regulator [Rhizorhapis sp. SPR117]|uniref:GntR family transcriptional regulator n=1 Tax=Rhizorhapis sp. SPR117 TaxID=2912611 RepID=UPI001F2677BF|nr:GntR family transcriptional regulator [Rhizorhapis sp. SPR117]
MAKFRATATRSSVGLFELQDGSLSSSNGVRSHKSAASIERKRGPSVTGAIPGLGSISLHERPYSALRPIREARSMSSDPVTTTRIYEQLKADIIGGRFPPRTRLVERALAVEYGVSISPVRSAAYCLVGEKLLKLHPGGGFDVPDITEDGLRDLYFWHGQLLRNALHVGKRAAPERPREEFESLTNLIAAAAIAAAAANLFSHIAGHSPNAQHRSAILAAGERLHVVRLREPLVLGGVADELGAVQALTVTGRTSDLMTAIWAYHRRRLRRVTDLVAAVGGTVHGGRSD